MIEVGTLEGGGAAKSRKGGGERSVVVAVARVKGRSEDLNHSLVSFLVIESSQYSNVIIM